MSFGSLLLGGLGELSGLVIRLRRRDGLVLASS